MPYYLKHNLTECHTLITWDNSLTVILLVNRIKIFMLYEEKKQTKLGKAFQNLQQKQFKEKLAKMQLHSFIRIR